MKITHAVVALGLLGSLSVSASSEQKTLKDYYEQDAKICDSLLCIRHEIDQINDQIIHLLVRRTAYVQRAGDIKAHTGNAYDQKRINDQLKVIGKKSEGLGLPKKVIVEPFRVLMQNSSDFEQEYINKKNH